MDSDAFYGISPRKRLFVELLREELLKMNEERDDDQDLDCIPYATPVSSFKDESESIPFATPVYTIPRSRSKRSLGTIPYRKRERVKYLVNSMRRLTSRKERALQDILQELYEISYGTPNR